MPFKTPPASLAAAWLIALAAMGSAGCQSAHVRQPLTASLSGNAPQTRLAFWHQLAQRPVVCNDEACHALLLFFNGDDASKNYAQRLKQLKSRHMLPEDFNRPADEAVMRGTLAVGLTTALNIKGGVIMRLLGSTPRYSVRELEYIEIYPPSSAQQTFSGQELIGIFGRAEDYQRSRSPQIGATALKADAPPALTEEAEADHPSPNTPP